MERTDFAGDSVGSISVNGQPATFSRAGQDPVITPAQPLPKDKSFVVTVSGYKAHPRRPSGSNILNNAFIITPDGSATLPQPSGAHVFLPSDDHPRDKATFTFHLDVPAGETAVANGELESQTTANGRTQFVYQQKQPMATAFRKIEREWISRYAGKSASTANYIALASNVSGKHLGPFLHDWLYGTKTPAMPGHPDWKVKTVREVEGRSAGRR